MQPVVCCVEGEEVGAGVNDEQAKDSYDKVDKANGNVCIFCHGLGFQPASKKYRTDDNVNNVVKMIDFKPENISTFGGDNVVSCYEEAEDADQQEYCAEDYGY